MRLFDKYLISIANQRIPMPSDWQESLGLFIQTNSQLQASLNGATPLHGYNFQQSDVLQRGYLSNEVRTCDLVSNRDLHYLLQLYLAAIKYHTGKDYTSYFPISVTTVDAGSGLHITTAPVILGKTYSFYARTMYPIKVEVYLSDILSEPIYSTVFSSSSPVLPLVLRTSRDWLQFAIPGQSSKRDYSYAETFAIFKVSADVPVVILPGEFAPLCVVSGVSNPHKLPIPSVGYSGAPYADKLIPSLLGINCPNDPPNELVEQILTRLGATDIEEAVPKRTEGIYDVDKNIGGKLRW